MLGSVGRATAYLERSATVVGVGATRSIGGGVDPELARERLWEQAPVVLEVQNLYNRHNAENLIYGGRQLYHQGRVTGLPIFPNLGFRADF